MNRDELLQLQAWLDGELPDSERRAWETRLASDPQARALVEELRTVRTALQNFDERAIRLPESREFYWSKIARAIQTPRNAPQQPAPKWYGWADWKRWLAPAAALGTLALVLTLSLPNSQPAEYPELDLAFIDSDATTYRDDVRNFTLIWFNYPAEH
ncbi:MAG: hypothetical protein RMN51_03035 [Verrucomicrobiota bacterium]|nr:hypothetical protein [Limisphaera sp.]MDW8381074.1 hypothetical protein [Verrucomicrobiota bacterium]